MTFELQVLQSLVEIDSTHWNQLLDSESGPFLRYEFLATLEEWLRWRTNWLANCPSRFT